MDLSEGTRIDRYVVERLLGRGGMASVWRVRHAELGSIHALKVLELAGRSIRARLLEEGKIQARLRHPNVVAVTDVILVDGAPGLVMEYVDGPTLEGWLATNRPTLAQIDALATDLLRGLRAAHALGLVHRDLKPANVLLGRGPDGAVIAKIADFGLAKALDASAGSDQGRTRSGQVMGTPTYMAPEQFRNAKDVDARTDLWSMGVMLYELTTGRRPYHGEDLIDLFEAVKRADWPSPAEVVPGLPERMDRAITGVLQVNRADRTPDCDALLRQWAGRAAEAASAIPWAGVALEARPDTPAARDQLTFQTTDEVSVPDWHAPPVLARPATTAPAAVPGGAGVWVAVASGALVLLFLATVVVALAGFAVWWTRAPEPVAVLEVAPTDPEPEVVVAPTPEPPAEPPPPMPPTGVVVVEGDLTDVRLATPWGLLGPGNVPEGVWTYAARHHERWIDGPAPVTVVAGGTSTITCYRALALCRSTTEEPAPPPPPPVAAPPPAPAPAPAPAAGPAPGAPDPIAILKEIQAIQENNQKSFDSVSREINGGR